MSKVPTSGLILHLDHHQLARLAAKSIDLELPIKLESCLTICCWICITDRQPTQVIINHGHRSWDEPGWSIFLHKGMVVASLRIGDRTITKSLPISGNGPWHHAAVSFDFVGAMANVYMDGKIIAAQTSDVRLVPPGPPARQENVSVGGYTDAAGGHFNYTFGGRERDRLDDLRFYGRPLTTQEIAGFVNPTNKPPVANYSIQLANKEAPTTAHLDASLSHDPDGSLIAYWWDLGDGDTAEGSRVTHTYHYAGRYKIRLTVLDDSHAQEEYEQTIELGGELQPVRFTPVFINGEEGYAGFRIPSIVLATNGDLVAFAEGRVESVSDSTRTIRIVCKRSQNNGRTWGPLQVAGRYLINGEEYAAMYPAPVVDGVRGSGRIVLLYKQLDRSEWEIVRGRGASRMSCVFSDDHGTTWHSERDITREVHRPGKWRIQSPTAGHAIQLRGSAGSEFLHGRLFYIGCHTVGDDSVFNQRNYAFWSDDLGKSWQIGPEIEQRIDGTTAKGLNEAMAVQLNDGRILINSRNYQDEQPVGCRAVTIGEFDDEGFLRFGPTRHDEVLIEPPVQSSILRYTWVDELRSGDQSVILFANPAHSDARRNLTIRVSYDNGATWPISKVVDSGPSSYSDLVEQTDGQIGILYERGNDGGICYGSFSYEWLTGNDVHSTVKSEE
jgi:sialidase-1